MKYKVGDKVKIKTWKKMEGEFGLNHEGNVFPIYPCFVKRQEEDLNELNRDRVLTIEEEKMKINFKGCEIDTYRMKDIGYTWSNEMIECLSKNYKESIPIYSRWEILDIR